MMLRTLLGWVSGLIVLVRDFIAPPVCYLCRRFIQTRTILCDECDVQIVPIAPKLIRVNSSYTMTVHAICRYDEPIKKLILAKHISDHVILQGLADLMWEKTTVAHIKVDCFVPIPLHWTRKLKRGFNQAQLLANRLKEHSGVCVYDMVKRVRNTHYQAQLEKGERKGNVKGAFVVKKGFDVRGKNIMLVDDLCTTGSTAVEVAKILAKHKPASISLLVACRAL